MNPLDLAGPQFLLFYFILCVFVMIGLNAAMRLSESKGPAGLPLEDPYQIAWLRGGRPEAARIAVLSLVDRGLLDLGGKSLAQKEVSVWQLPRHTLERAVYNVAAGGAEAKTVLDDAGVVVACDDLRRQLERRGLAPDEAVRRQRWGYLVTALTIVLGMAALKIAVALARGKTNLLFLFLMALVAGFILWRQSQKRRTARGDEALVDLRRLLGGLRDRAQSIRAGQMTADAMLLAAVFGLTALPTESFAALRSFFPQASGSSDGGGSSCGSGGGGGCGGCGS